MRTVIFLPVLVLSLLLGCADSEFERVGPFVLADVEYLSSGLDDGRTVLIADDGARHIAFCHLRNIPAMGTEVVLVSYTPAGHIVLTSRLEIVESETVSN